MDNQLENKFKFEFPKFQEIENSTRLDTGTYSTQFKHIDFLIKIIDNIINKILTKNTLSTIVILVFKTIL